MTTVNTDSDKKTGRGRKKISEGGTASPRKILVACAAILANGELIFDEVHCVDSDKETKDDAILAEAATLFEAAHGVAPTKIGKPHFPRNEVGTTKKRETCPLKIDEVDFVPSRKGSAVYNEWQVSVKFLADVPSQYKDYVYVIFKSHTKDEKKAKPANKFVNVNTLKDLVEVA